MESGSWPGVFVASPDRPTWAEVDAGALAHNLREWRAVAGVPVMAVLKANAYGHGAVWAARVAHTAGVRSLGVACLSEALELRRAGIEAETLVLGYTPPWQARDAVGRGVSVTVFGWEEAEALSRAAVDLGRSASVHVKVDTGMGRIGLSPEEAPGFIGRLRGLPGLEVAGVFTHFGSADQVDQSYAYRQLDRFLSLVQALEARGMRPPKAHAANTAAALTMPAACLDLVRVGIGLYGLSPSHEVPLPDRFRPVLSFKTIVSQVKEVRPGTYLGYGQGHPVRQPMVVAVIPVGYADGFRRGPVNWGEVLVRGRRCPLVGNVCMDQSMVDVGGVPGVRQGDEVVLIGGQGAATISVGEVADGIGTNPHEVVCAISARVPRVSVGSAG